MPSPNADNRIALRIERGVAAKDLHRHRERFYPIAAAGERFLDYVFEKLPVSVAA